MLSKFGNLSIREILVVTSAYVRTDSGGGGGESQDNPTGVENAIFSWREIARCLWATAFFLAGNRMTIVAFEKEVSLKSLSLFSKTIVRQYCSFEMEKKHLISINGKKKFKRILVEINVKKILAVINATYAVAKRKPEKSRLAGIRTLTSAIPVQRSNQLS